MKKNKKKNAKNPVSHETELAIEEINDILTEDVLEHFEKIEDRLHFVRGLGMKRYYKMRAAISAGRHALNVIESLASDFQTEIDERQYEQSTQKSIANRN